MVTQHVEKKRAKLGIPAGAGGEHRRQVFKKVRDTFYTDPHVAQEHNTCANSEVRLSAVEGSFKKEDLELE